MPKAETVGDRLNRMLPGALDRHLTPNWPPDVFCLCAALLHSSGAYSLVVDDNPLQGTPDQSRKRAVEIEALGSKWRTAAGVTDRPPTAINKWWKVIRANANCHVSRIARRRTLAAAILNLLGASDEACHSLGLYFPGATNRKDEFAAQAERRLLDSLGEEHGSTLCKDIHPSEGRVLPKMHTPQNGLTVRSLSHHLAYCSAPDICPQWLSAGISNRSHSFNLLIVPWPPKVEPSQFRATRKFNITDHVEGASYGLFTFHGSRGPSRKKIRSLIEQGNRKVGHIDGIIFPELAMSRREFGALVEEIDQNCFLVAGIGQSATLTEPGHNEAAIHVNLPLGEEIFAPVRFTQRKHHRWKLTKSQVCQYGIGHNLNPNSNWWEHINLGGRRISFVTFRPWLTTSVLICEDLARPDPVGDILRAVGPNLLIALLCDVPQLIGRWPGRYAGAFADDPGSSVLTLTSSGMSNLSRPVSGSVNKSKTVAPWRDAKTGAHELELPDTAEALVLNIAVEYHEEWTADGRRDGGFSGYPILAGYHPISSDV